MRHSARVLRSTGAGIDNAPADFRFTDAEFAPTAWAKSASDIAALMPSGRVKNGSPRSRITASTSVFELLHQLITSPRSDSPDEKRAKARQSASAPESVTLISSVS